MFNLFKNKLKFADQVEGMPVSASELAPPTKGRKCTKTVFRKMLNDGLERWRKSGRKYMEEALL
jgi:hypothetical protein